MGGVHHYQLAIAMFLEGLYLCSGMSAIEPDRVCAYARMVSVPDNTTEYWGGWRRKRWEDDE